MVAVHIEGARHPPICLFETPFSCQCPFNHILFRSLVTDEADNYGDVDAISNELDDDDEETDDYDDENYYVYKDDFKHNKRVKRHVVETNRKSPDGISEEVFNSNERLDLGDDDIALLQNSNHHRRAVLQIHSIK
jgi:hypothetical protein